jgi:hypothetical protein
MNKKDPFYNINKNEDEAVLKGLDYGDDHQ